MKSSRARICVLMLVVMSIPVLLPGGRTADAEETKESARRDPEPRHIVYHYTVAPNIPLEVALEHLPNRRAWEQYVETRPNQHVSLDKRTGRPFRVEGLDPSWRMSPRASRAEFEKTGLDFVAAHNDILRIPDEVTLRLRPGSTGLPEAALSDPSTASNIYLAIFDFYLGEVPIRNSRLTFEFRSGVSDGFNMSALGDLFLDLRPQVSSTQAVSSIERYVGDKIDERYQTRPALTVVRIETAEEVTYLLGWEFMVELGSSIRTTGQSRSYRTIGQSRPYRVLVDARSGEVVEFVKTWIER